MNKSDRGLKHFCAECMIKYYDLRKETVACPKCGAKPIAPRGRKVSLRARKTSRATFWRYP